MLCLRVPRCYDHRLALSKEGEGVRDPPLVLTLSDLGERARESERHRERVRHTHTHTHSECH